MKKALINIRLYDYQTYKEDAYVIFDKEIIEVGEMNHFHNDGYKIIDGKGKLLLPNFVCAHAHIYSIFARGLSLPFSPTNFQEILDQMWWKLDSQIDNEITYFSGIAAGTEFIKNGVTTIIDHHASGKDILSSLSSLKKSLVDTLNLRAILCFETSDRYKIDDCIKENVSFVKRFHNEHIAGLFGLHASMSLSENSLKLIKRKQKNIPLHVHAGESIMDEEDSINKYGLRIIDRFNKYGLIKEDSLIVHGVYLDEQELDIIKNLKAYMVVNTTSNMNNAVGLPNVKAFINKGIPVLVGNDGLSTSMANEYNNVFYSSHLKNESAITLDLNDILNMIHNAYDYVSKRLNIKIGKLEKGYVSDFMLVPYTPFTKMDNFNAFGHVFYGLYPSFKPSDVFVDGKLLLKNYELVSKKGKEELNKARVISNKLWERVL